MNRAIVIVLDGVGAGEAPDAHEFGDEIDPNTLLHVAEAAGGIDAPLLADIGFLSSTGAEGGSSVRNLDSAFGRLKPLSKGGKDSVTGHWEMMGVVVPEAFPTYPNGFPSDLISAFEARIGSGILGNKAASGTAIIAELGAEHMTTRKPIVYTSADSVFQIACHEGVVPIERLYEMCRIARELCGVQRVIARPFEGPPGAFVRTDRRKDFPLPAPENLLDRLHKATFGIGVVPELFAGRGFRPVRRTQNNAEHWLMMDEALESDASFIFANFEDFDMRFGHRNDAIGFAGCLTEFDRELQARLPKLGEGDLLILTADHGNDPTTPSTDHSREYVPFVAVRLGGSIRKPLGDLDGFAHVGDAVAHHLGVEKGFDPFA
jgi:phosphopentomutase